MKLTRFECESCRREFVLAEGDVVAEDEMTCPIDACQGSVVNLDIPDEDEDDD